MQFRARFVANIIQFAAQQGVDKNKLLALTDKSMQELCAEDLMVDAQTYNRIVEQTEVLSGDDLFGLHLGEYLSLSAAGLIVQIAQSSRTVLEALHYMVEYANLGCQALPYQLKELEQEWELSLSPNTSWLEASPIAVRHTMDGNIVFTLREFHTLTRQKHYPNRIHFSYPKPGRFTEYERLFNCPIRFGQPLTAIYLDKKQAQEKVVTSDYRLLQLLIPYAKEKLAAMEGQLGFATIVKQSIINLVKPQFPTIEQVAANLNLSVRTLQRRLKEEALTYKLVLDELKKQFALDYLKNKDLSIKEVTYLLDYAEPSSFVRSFKRWTGETPKTYQQRFN